MSKAQLRKPAPDFTAKAYMPSGEFKEVKLSDYKGKYVVLFFWPLDFTFVCPTEIVAFGKLNKEFEANNTVLLGCSIDSEFVHMEYCLKPRKSGGLGPMDCPLIADVTKKICTEYGCLFEEMGVAYRATYIIDDKGILRHSTVGDLPVGRNPNETLRLVQAFQFADKHGEVCPASWKPGDKAMETKLVSKRNEEIFANLDK